MHRLDAQEPAPLTSAPSGFQPYEGGEPQRDGAVLMVQAYAAVWVILMLAVLFSHLRQRRLDARIARLEAALDRVIEEEQRVDGGT